jgi:hypothetical protein
MEKLVFIITFTFFVLSPLIAQKTIKKIIIDNETGKPVSGAHIYKSDDLKTGTVTNKDGKFVLNRISENDIVQVNHISYVTFTMPVSLLKSDTIAFQRKNYILKEVVVATGKAIIQKVIDSLYINHFVEPVMYEVYIRVSEFEKDYSELHVLSEYLMNVYQNKKNKSEIQVIKTRAKPFSKAGKKYFKDMRMIDAISINSDNIFRFQDDIFKKKNLKNYDITIDDNHINKNNDLIKLLCKHKKDNTSIVLFIDRTSYAVYKMIKYYSESGEEFKEIGFKEVNNKWYLDYSELIKYSDFFSKWKSNSNSIKKRTVIYNINDSIRYDSKFFKTAFNLVAEPIKYHLGDWSDDFWDNYNYVPLTDWIKQEVDKENSR